MKIRKAKLDDALGISKVHVDSWRTTYRPSDRVAVLVRRIISNKSNLIV